MFQWVNLFFSNQYLRVCPIYDMKTSNPLLLPAVSFQGSLSSQMNRQTKRWVNQRPESSNYPVN